VTTILTQGESNPPTASYYVTFDNDTRFSGYSTEDESSLIVGTIPESNGELPAQCPARVILRDNTKQLNPLRNYRDTVLSKTGLGSFLIKLYYRLGPDMCAILNENPALLKQYRILLTAVLQ